METAIREGELRILTSETPYNVVLSCQGKKLTAHKLILSIASPVLQELLLQDSTDTTMLIFPDIDGNTMSLVLEYIYNGNVTVSAYDLPEFLGVASLLKLHLDVEKYARQRLETKPPCCNLQKDIDRKLCPKKMPNLMPISSLQKRTRDTTMRKGLNNHVIPSPWCPRVSPLLADPREDCSLGNEKMISLHNPEKKIMEENDTNNNFEVLPRQPLFASAALRNCVSKVVGPPVGILSTPKSTPPSPPSLCTTPPPMALTTHSTNPPAIHTEINEKKFNNSVIYKSDPEQPSKINDQDVKEIIDLKREIKEDARLEINNIKSSRNTETDEKDTAFKNEGQKMDKHKPFRCHDCGKTFSQLRNYKYHRSIHEGTREFAARCPECGKIFNDRGYLSSHLKIHRDRKEYACPNCPKRFNQRVAYNMHLRIHTGVKPHECLTCGKTFSRKMLLKQHQRVHTGERPYSCPECGKSFADRSNMSLHARLHTGVKPYACNLCPKSFTKKHHLKTHMNFHTGLKPYSCQKCGVSFSQSSNMRTHYKKCILKSTAIKDGISESC